MMSGDDLDGQTRFPHVVDFETMGRPVEVLSSPDSSSMLQRNFGSTAPIDKTKLEVACRRTLYPTW